MSAGLQSLRRIRHLRALQERMSEAELMRRNQDRCKAEERAASYQATLRQNLEDGRTALLGGDPSGRLLAQAVTKSSLQAVANAEATVVAAREAADVAQEIFGDRRRATEQVSLLEEQLAASERYADERRAQSVGDDLFASRANWLARRLARRLKNG